MLRIKSSFYTENADLMSALNMHLNTNLQYLIVHAMENDTIVITGSDTIIKFYEKEDYVYCVSSSDGVMKDVLFGLGSKLGLELNKLYLSI